MQEDDNHLRSFLGTHCTIDAPRPWSHRAVAEQGLLSTLLLYTTPLQAIQHTVQTSA